MTLETLVQNWLLGGTDPEVGSRLFLDYCNPSKATARIITKDPSRHIQTIRTALLKKANVPYNTAIAPTSSSFATRTSENGVCNADKKNQYSTRTQWPFLSDPECPPELKLLISDKITAYRDCVKQYENLTKATTAREQLQAVSALVSNFIENHNIYKELQHYKEKKETLGEHPMFAQYNRIKSLRNLQTMDLFRTKKNIENNIWRTEKKIRTDTRPDLLATRRSKLKQLKLELAEVDRLLT